MAERKFYIKKALQAFFIMSMLFIGFGRFLPSSRLPINQQTQIEMLKIHAKHAVSSVTIFHSPVNSSTAFSVTTYSWVYHALSQADQISSIILQSHYTAMIPAYHDPAFYSPARSDANLHIG